MDRYDELMTRCPRLGGEVTFAYCRIEQGRLPCSRIIACWHPAVPVETWLRENLSPEEQRQFAAAPAKDKITSLFEIVDSLQKKP